MVERILVIRFKAIGDVMFTRPAVAALKAAFPEARITFITGAITAPLVRTFSEVDDVLIMDRREVGWNRPLRTLRTVCRIWNELRGRRFDLGIDLHGNGESALTVRSSGAPRRWGWSVGVENRRWYTKHVSVAARPGLIHVTEESGIQEMHPADWHLEFLRRCGIPAGNHRTVLALPLEAKHQAENFWRDRNLGEGRKVIFFQPFSSSTPKDWPLQKQLATAAHWRRRGFRIVFGGSAQEVPCLQPAIEAGFPVAAGLDLLAMTALMARCVLSVGSDTGLIHLAHAAGARVLDLRQYKNVYPHQHPERAITAPRKGRVDTISVESVWEAMERALSESGAWS